MEKNTINGRNYSIKANSLSDELTLSLSENYLFDLSHVGIINVEGLMAADFLQGQLSCDIRAINEHTMRQGAQCNLKGRVLALLDTIYWDRHYQLLLPKDLIDSTLLSLSKMALVSRITLTSSHDDVIYAIHAPRPFALPHSLTLPTTRHCATNNEVAYCYALGTDDYILIVKSEAAADYILAAQNNCQSRGALGWHHLQLSSLNMQIYPQTRGLYLPQRLGLEESGHINFEKGCYKGQEIIARMHYRGTIKHALQSIILPTETTEPPFDTALITHLDEIIDYCPHNNLEHLIVASVHL